MKILAVLLSLLLSVTRGAEFIFYDNYGELTAEPGLTAVLGCTFTVPADFKPTSVAWLRCDSKPQCKDEKDYIFHSEDVNAGQDQFRRRVSMLEPDLSKKNCSIVIRDLDVSDSGSYHPIVDGYIGQRGNRLYATRKKAMKVAGLRQPRIRAGMTTVLEGGTLHLTCDAKSSPPSTVKWTKVGSDSPLVTDSQAATLLIQNVTGEHSGHYSCTAHHLTKTLIAFADVTVIPAPAVPMIPDHHHVIITIILVIIVALVAIGAPMAYMIRRHYRENHGEWEHNNVQMPVYENVQY